MIEKSGAQEKKRVRTLLCMHVYVGDRNSKLNLANTTRSYRDHKYNKYKMNTRELRGSTDQIELS